MLVGVKAMRVNERVYSTRQALAGGHGVALLAWRVKRDK
jgi:hypothetical protein